MSGVYIILGARLSKFPAKTNFQAKIRVLRQKAAVDILYYITIHLVQEVGSRHEICYWLLSTAFFSLPSFNIHAGESYASAILACMWPLFSSTDSPASVVNWVYLCREQLIELRCFCGCSLWRRCCDGGGLRLFRCHVFA